MRIRKRKVPLPLSSLLPVPLLDLYSNLSPTATTALYFCGGDIDGGDGGFPPPLSLSVSDRLIQREVMRKKKEDDYNNNNKALVDNDNAKNINDASSSKNGKPRGEPNSSTQVVEKNETIVSLRKRRSLINFKELKEDDEEEEEEAKGKKKKKAKKSGVLEEGSRCSRVNGRGWRCCQQTLFGYSLCEHHLGKGRVRSMMNKSGGRGGEKKGVAVVEVIKKKRVKLGMVKARSISSLLGQSNNTSSGDNVVVAIESEISALNDQFGVCDK